MKKWFGRILLSCALIALAMGLSALADTALDISSQCKFKVSEGSAKALTDSKIKTRWEPDKDEATLYIKLPETGAGYLYVEWVFEPTAYALEQYDADKALISDGDASLSHAGINQLFMLDPKARYAFLQLKAPGQALCGVRVYSQGVLSDDIQDWEAPYDKCDLMVVSTHQDDEFIFFGGIIPYYERVMHRQVQVVYMTDCHRLRRGEALNGLWTVGLRHYPDFINLKDEKRKSLERSLEDWGGRQAVLEELVELIRRYKPEVILTHDLNGEYGHPQHILTASAMESAIRAAADAGQFPDSVARYGVWQVKKLYLHLYEQDSIQFNWKKNYAELDGKTPLEVARAGYAKHVSQQKAYQVKDGGRYDNARFGLSYSVVGGDELHQDLFENVLYAPAVDLPLVDAAQASGSKDG